MMISNKKRKWSRMLMPAHVPELMIDDQAQSPQLWESDPTFWILNAVPSNRVTHPVLPA
jgi:hypothetical protein